MVIAKRRVALSMFSILILLITISSSFAVDLEAETDCIYYFTSIGCEECVPADDTVGLLEAKYPNLHVEKFEVYYDQGHKGTLDLYLSQFSVPQSSQGIPIAFIGGSYLVGSSSISELLEARILENEGSACPQASSGVIGLVDENKTTQNVLETIGFIRVTGDGIARSFTAGMVAAFLVLLGLLAGMKDDETLIKRGAVFVVLFFIMDILSTTGVLQGFGGKAASSFYKIVGFSALVVSIVRIKAFFTTWQILLKSVPETLRKKGRRVKKILHSPGGFSIAAIITSLFAISIKTETGELLRNLYMSGLKAPAFPLILYYSLLSIIPIIVIVAILYITHHELEEKAEEKASSESKILAWRAHYQKQINFVASALMVIIGLMLLFM